MRPNKPNRTPFDNDLVDDPNAPRHTQPLPSSVPPAQPGAGQPRAGMPRTLPPQVVTGGMQDDDDLYSRRPPKRQGLPSATVIGAAMMIGALAVILISIAVSRILPRPQVTPLRPPDAPAPGIVAPKPKTNTVEEAPTKAEAPAAEAPARTETPAAVEAADEPPLSNDLTPVEAGSESEPPGRTDGGEPVLTDEREQAEERLATSEGRGSSRSRARDGEPQSDRDLGEERSRETEPSREEQPRTERTRSERHFVNERRGYAIRPPAGFTLQQSGRRTLWRGPGGAQLLVETASVGGRSPRADWERMDQGFRKKYGSRYRSHGIYETTLAGRPAAAWEFQIGSIRKIDIAVHHRGTGYAVLGSAPAARFEEVRPQIEAAIRSFQLSSDSEGSRKRETWDDEDSDARGY